MSYIFYSFSNGTKENDKKEALLFHSYIKRNLVPRLPRGPLRACISAKLFLVNFLFQWPRAARSCQTLASQTMVSTKFFLTTLRCSTCTAISPAGEEVILKKTLPHYARNSSEKSHLKTYALKEEKCSFPSASFDAIFSGASKVILDIFYFALLCCVIGPQSLRHFFNRLDLKSKPITL